MQSSADASAPPPEAFDSNGAVATVVARDAMHVHHRGGLGMLGVHEPYVSSLVRKTENWPRQGVSFLDMSALLADSRALKFCIDALAERYGGGGITHVAGIDARGFTVGCACKF